MASKNMITAVAVAGIAGAAVGGWWYQNKPVASSAPAANAPAGGPPAAPAAGAKPGAPAPGPGGGAGRPGVLYVLRY